MMQLLRIFLSVTLVVFSVLAQTQLPTISAVGYVTIYSVVIIDRV